MGLLDKVENKDEDKPKAKSAVAKAVAKPKAKAKPKSVEIPTKETPKAVKAKKAKPKAEKIRPTGLPEGYELAGKMPRYIGWLINFAWNFGALIGTLSIFMFGDPDLTIGFLVAGLMILVNWMVIPIWMGRNVGEFVSRTKYINSSGTKPLFLHALLNNSLGFLSLGGFGLVIMNINQNGDMAMVGLGAGMILLWIVNFFFKKNSDYSQGLFDMAFNAYLVKHIATGSETGWAARFESLGDFGDKWAEKQEQRRVKAEEKAKQKAEAKAAEEESESEEDSEENKD